MTFEEFRQLIEKGETTFVDFKLSCNAFDKTKGDNEKSKAELVKDICSMANNGSTTSYLVIGVSDDRKRYESVTNTQLTSANVQTLIRDSIYPRPMVRVHEKFWAQAPSPFKNKRFVIIQIGPHAKDAYRFTKDYVSPGSGWNFRKNQVWVRNQDTSDIATPEQIVRLKTKNKSSGLENEINYVNVEYEKLSAKDRVSAVSKDLRRLFTEQNCRMTSQRKRSRSMPWLVYSDFDFRVILKIGKNELLIRCGLRQEFTMERTHLAEIEDSWSGEHGVLILLEDNVRKSVMSRRGVSYKMPWGWFTSSPVPFSGYLDDYRKPGVTSEGISFLTLPQIRDTTTLRNKITGMIRSIETDKHTLRHIGANRRILEAFKVSLRKKSWEELAGKFDHVLPSFKKERYLAILKYLRQASSQ